MMHTNTLGIQPPYYAVIFSSRLNSENDPDYQLTARHMEELASQQPGYLGVESVRDDEGKGITVSYWKDLQAIKRWKQQVDHLSAQASGKSKWYRSYNVKISLVEKSYGFEHI